MTIAGLIPTVVSGGIALKFTEAFLSKPKGNKTSKKRRVSKKSNRPGNKYSP